MILDLEPRAFDSDFYASLWIGALLLDGNDAFEVFPEELEELTREFLELFRPVAKA